uniref:Protein kinase domain-containing protein n=1 Tax=Haptolina ericina TaxID=156174 RepID=A0A7S3EU05_9EUKA
MDMNIYELIRGRRHYLPESRIKVYMYQLLKSMDHMHRNGIFHRDIKPENILITDDELKLADFGSCRGIYSKQPYTEYISTRWYRAPECLLTDGFYNYKMDMWGVGCVFFEVLSLYPLFPGTNELDQVTKIHQILGTPTPEVLAKLKKHSNSHIDFNFPHKDAQQMSKLIPHCSPECVDIIVKLLAYDPDDRLSARQAVKHPYFKEQRAAEAKEKAQSAGEAEASSDAPPPTVGGSHRPRKESNNSVLPSIGGMGGGRKHLTDENDSSVYQADGPGGAHGDEDGGSMLPPIAGFGNLHGQQGGVSTLKIDSKSLLAGKGKAPLNTQKRTGAMPHKKVGAACGGKFIGGTVPQMGRSCNPMCHDAPDFGVGNSSQHASQSQISEPESLGAVGGKGLQGAGKGAKSYCSPYSQRFQQKTKV